MKKNIDVILRNDEKKMYYNVNLKYILVILNYNNKSTIFLKALEIFLKIFSIKNIHNI